MPAQSATTNHQSRPLRVALLGSTGSIGQQVLDVAGQFPERLRIVALTARTDLETLQAEARQVRPELVGLTEPAPGSSPRWDGGPVATGAQALIEAATLPDLDLVIIAVVGTAGLPPALAALNAGTSVALATKEALVVGGHLMTEAARRTGAALLPIDSEHSAIFQCLQGSQPNEAERIILTASGGPFVDTPLAQLEQMTPEQALRHPTWRMGPKITIDSATLMNKGLEVIEAKWLFNLPPSQIDIVVHRQSIVHSLVQFCDSSVLAQLGLPDMRLPIQYAIFYPERLPNALPRLDLAQAGMLTFEPPDRDRFPAVSLAYQAAAEGGSLPAVLSAGNEQAVQLFLEGKTAFTGIARRIACAMERHELIAAPTFEEIIEVDRWAREAVSAETA
jgi:1-deoxy-D-xylulose-5-phosphate reductoisomerase